MQNKNRYAKKKSAKQTGKNRIRKEKSKHKKGGRKCRLDKERIRGRAEERRKRPPTICKVKVTGGKNRSEKKKR